MGMESMAGGGGGAMGAMSGMMSAYSKGVKPQGGQAQPPPQNQQQPFRQNQPGPVQAQPIPTQAPQVTHPQADWTGQPVEYPVPQTFAQTRGQAAGNASRASSLQTAIQNFHQAQALSSQAPPQSIQAQTPQRQPQGNLAELTRQLQADSAQESAGQEYKNNPNYQWASQQQVAPEQIGTMDSAENYVNQNAYTPPNLLTAMKGTYG